jgi:hypothetical protein
MMTKKNKDERKTLLTDAIAEGRIPEGGLPALRYDIYFPDILLVCISPVIYCT